MMRLVMETVMLLAIVGGMIVVSKISASENKAIRQIENDTDADTPTPD